MKSTDANKKNEALHYLHICSSAGTVSSEAAPFINPIIEETTVSQKTIQQEKNTQIQTKKELVSQAGLNIAGFCFLLLALILYIISVNNDYGVANIQTTVFSAAAFVVGSLCFVGARIIKAFRAMIEK